MAGLLPGSNVPRFIVWQRGMRMVVAQRSMPAHQSPTYQVALAALEAGLSVLPIRPDGSKQPALPGWKRYQQEMPTAALLEEWFRHPERGLAFVTGYISGGLIALDFDDLATFDAWLMRIRREHALHALYEFIASGYEERTPKNGRHLLFRCPAAFGGSQRPGNQRLALRPATEPQRFQVLAETREEGGMIIVDPSRGGVHPSGKPYVRIRGGISTIRAITTEERALLYDSIRAFDEMPPAPAREPAPAQPHCLTFRHSG